MSRYKKPVVTYAKGFAMGITDIVPGVSGGTVAIILGVYDRLVRGIASINIEFFKTFFKGEFKKAFDMIDFYFLAILASGILSALLLMSRIVHYIMETYPTQTWAFFFGLILASIVYLKNQTHNFFKPLNLILLAIGTIAGYLIVGAIPVETPTDYFTIFFSGMLGIIAMILPGISGSFILLILGKYIFIMNAIKNPFLPENFIILTVFGLGCITGAISFSKVLSYLLTRFHDFTLCLLTGFMVGSLRKIWPWRETLETILVKGQEVVIRERNVLPLEYDLGFIMAVALLLLGFSAVILLESSGKKMLHNN